MTSSIYALSNPDDACLAVDCSPDKNYVPPLIADLFRTLDELQVVIDALDTGTNAMKKLQTRLSKELAAKLDAIIEYMGHIVRKAN
eukprot:COSAG01_NODE_56017_length_321_cov_0.711712_1_plen_85_part_10